MGKPIPMVELWRGGLLESTHLGHAVLVDDTGQIVQAWGDPERIIFPRSSCKMIQALPLMESGAGAGLRGEQLALTRRDAEAIGKAMRATQQPQRFQKFAQAAAERVARRAAGRLQRGRDVAQALRRQNPSVGLVFLTSFDDPRLLSANLPQLPGNSQYLTKSAIGDVDQLVKAVRLAF